jgi:hypothetical protein
MIPDDLHLALAEGRTLPTDAGSGPTVVRRLADLVLPTGRILLGYPGSPLVNEPSPIRPEVPPGRYPVYASLVELPRGYRELVFVVACFRDTPPTEWEDAGSFFTDSGIGCLMDESIAPHLERAREYNPEFWRVLCEQKMGVFGDGDCGLVLDETTAANAIVFKTYDSRYPCYLGRDADALPTWLVVDCR